MKILLTGASGYVGKRLLPVLQNEGHEVTCLVRDQNRFLAGYRGNDLFRIIEMDLLDEMNIPQGTGSFDVGYYLVHSMSSSIEGFESMEEASALNFLKLAEQLQIRQVIYLSGIINEEKLSRHLSSRKNVEDILRKGTFHLTVLRAGIVVGSGSASFEIIRDLVEKLPAMVTPRWLLTRSKPIAIRDVILFLTGVAGNEYSYDRTFDIGGPEVLTYKDMLMTYAHVRKLKRWIFTLPVMTPRLSSYWLYFVTSVSYPLAVNLVNSMKTDVIPRENDLAEKLGISPLTYQEAIEKAFLKIEQNMILSSWKDSLISSMLDNNLSDHIEVPSYGCFQDIKKIKIENPERILANLWSIGGKKGWYYANWLWGIRGFLDKLSGGVGLRRGRTHPTEIHHGDALDFWRVLYASKEVKRLLLYAEMKLPGEAWLEFKLDNDNYLHQVATFRPRGLSGRLYWWMVFPFHIFVFRGMIRNIAKE
ncbi:MAG: SDR family oxidoreductase [Bacteroidales bacterium]|nr:SDR family oxidoreductase [Bacteroidales bacterium]